VTSSAERGSSKRLRPFQFGWHGDNGIGEALIAKILSGHKTATACPAYDPQEVAEGELVRLVDKAGNTRAILRITAVDTLLYKDIDPGLAFRLGFSLDDMRRLASYSNSREIGESEEIRITHFEVVENGAR
jgi:uncharacterized protein YhfF